MVEFNGVMDLWLYEKSPIEMIISGALGCLEHQLRTLTRYARVLLL